jgi:hypothetical protein
MEQEFEGFMGKPPLVSREETDVYFLLRFTASMDSFGPGGIPVEYDDEWPVVIEQKVAPDCGGTT